MTTSSTDNIASAPTGFTGLVRVEAYDKTVYPDGQNATVDAQTARRIGAHVGDVVLIRTSSGAHAVVRLSEEPPETGHNNVIRLDSLTRMTLGTRLGADVDVSLLRGGEPSRITVEIDASLLGDVGDAGEVSDVPARITSLLCEGGLPVVEGDVVAVPAGPLGSYVVLRVVDVDGHAGRVGQHTRIDLKPADLTEFTHVNNGGLADVGGLGSAVDELREVVELAIYYPDILDRLGLNPARGVILHGPPGGGKTLLCRSMAGEFDAAFYYISGPEVVGSLHGQTEESLRAVFADATDHAPAIICIDEVEALTRNRRALSNQADLRAVAQLLALMDGLRRSPRVFVIGTTNQVHLLDPAFRRPGRFDREISISEPDERARLEILHVQTRSMPLSRAAREMLPEVASRTVGYTGADLASLCQRAGTHALRRIIDRTGLRDAEAVLASTEAIDVADLTESAESSRPASARDGHVEQTAPVRLAGKTPALDRLRTVADSMTGLVEGQAGGLRAGVLLVGPSGSGKSSLVRKLAHDLGLRLVVIKGPELATRWLGETEESVRQLSELTSRLKPSLLLLDHVESMAPRRTAHEPTSSSLATQLASVIAELTATDGVIVVGTTSRLDLVDELVLGPTGLRIRIDVGLPDEQDRGAIIAAALSDRGISLPGEEIGSLARSTDALTPGDLAICVALACHAAKVASDLSEPAEPATAAQPTAQLGVLLRTEFTRLQGRDAETGGSS